MFYKAEYRNIFLAVLIIFTCTGHLKVHGIRQKPWMYSFTECVYRCCGFIDVCLMPIFMDFLVQLIHEMKYNFLITFRFDRISGHKFTNYQKLFSLNPQKRMPMIEWILTKPQYMCCKDWRVVMHSVLW